MDDGNKKEFWAIINVTMELTNRPPLSKEAVITWWNILNKFDIESVRSALDKWCDTETKPPTPSGIKDLCKPKVDIYAKLPSPLTKQANATHAKEVVEFVKDNTKPKRDHKAWARRILGAPKSYPDIAARFAKEALNFND